MDPQATLLQSQATIDVLRLWLLTQWTTTLRTAENVGQRRNNGNKLKDLYRRRKILNARKSLNVMLSPMIYGLQPSLDRISLTLSLHSDRTNTCQFIDWGFHTILQCHRLTTSALLPITMSGRAAHFKTDISWPCAKHVITVLLCSHCASSEEWTLVPSTLHRNSELRTKFSHQRVTTDDKLVRRIEHWTGFTSVRPKVNISKRDCMNLA